MTTDDRRGKGDIDAQEASRRRAATSLESATNVTRSTQNLTTGGTEKRAESQSEARPSHKEQLPRALPGDESATPRSTEASAERKEQSTDGRSNAEQAVKNQQRALESGQESPG